ncbi:MAG TPA: hypothetical protein VE591_01470 [Candidatus Acidoferrum sp.]|nr:hypothetical protein [Candidatus Acidoferrum sp.]
MVPFGYWAAVIGADLFATLATFAAIASGSQRVLTPARQRRFLAVIALLGAAWAALIGWSAGRGVFHFSAAYPFPFVVLAIALPPLVGALALLRSATVRSLVSAIPQRQLIGIQTIRLAGVVFLVAMLQARLPAVFALPAGIGDISVGLAAALIVLRSRDRESPSARTIALWNAGGILDLVVATTIGFLASTTPMRLIFSSPSTDFVTATPLVLIPAFGVPLFLLLHIASLDALRRANEKGRLEGRPPVVTATQPIRRPA